MKKLGQAISACFSGVYCCFYSYSVSIDPRKEVARFFVQNLISVKYSNLDFFEILVQGDNFGSMLNLERFLFRILR